MTERMYHEVSGSWWATANALAVGCEGCARRFVLDPPRRASLAVWMHERRATSGIGWCFTIHGDVEWSSL